MSTRSPVPVIGVAAVVGALIAGAVALQHLRETAYPAATAVEDSLDITSGEALRRLTIGYNALAADLYWIRTIQYYGGIKLRSAPTTSVPAPPDADYHLLYPLLDVTTTLDPRFSIAYRFGAIFLAEPIPGGAGRPDLAIRLLEKGLRTRPDKWEYMQDIGFVHYWWRRDYRAAAEWFSRASERPGAPWWLRSLAATTLAEGGDRRSSRVMWQAIHDSAEIDWLKGDAERRLLQLDALDAIDFLQGKIDAYVAATGRVPSDWATLVRARAFRVVPPDPTGIPFVLDSSGRVQLSTTSPLFPLPDEPKALGPPPS
jgi:hypothetical protein